jgi:NAD(P)H-hydrate epimerase
MKILTATQIREADSYTIAHEPVSAIDLMERAAQVCISEILSYRDSRHYTIVCGIGNNGGDGLAIARILHTIGKKTSIYLVQQSTTASDCFTTNLSRLTEISEAQIYTVHQAADISTTEPDTIIIDAQLGTGTDRPTGGLVADVINHINRSGLAVIAIDIPSGLPAELTAAISWPVVRASVTLTFQQPKLSFMFAESGDYVGDLRILDIGLSRDYIASAPDTYHYTELSDITPLLPGRSRFSHKGTYGHSLLIAGSHGRMGAAVLAARACLRSGTGLLTVHIPACGYDIMQGSVPEAMVTTDTHTDHITHIPSIEPYSSIGIGPGIGTDGETALALKLLIQSAACPLVLDADALNIISLHKTWLAFLPPRSILTPHPAEFDRLTEKHTDSSSRLRSAQDLAHRHSLIIVLKGAYTAVVMPDRSVRFNSTGSPALARGGSGDILTGIITSLIARGYSEPDAAITAVYLHGLAADLAVADIHPESLTAGDVVSYIPAAFEKAYSSIKDQR